MLVDSHCHLDKIDLSSFDQQLSVLLDTAQQADVSQYLCVCIDLEHFDDVHNIAKQYKQIHCSVGVHPTSQGDDVYEPSADELIALANSERVIAIGETGLDYFRIDDDDMTWQQDRFRQHIQAAKVTQKPLIIHTRSAKEDTIRILTEENADEVGGVMHCFAEDWDTAKKALDLGFYISFSGIVTFKSAKTLQEVAKKVPQDRMLIETDSPWLAPTPKRGKLNHPAYLRYTAEKMAELRGCSYQTLAEITTENYQRLFSLN
jgi:TatD DNase family protein